jgi:hypothetical protein
MAGKFKKGQSGNPGGRRRGAANKVTRAFREAISVVFDGLGGTAHLLKWARENTTEFYRIAARLVPPGSPINLGPLTGTIADQGKLVIDKISEGAITPEQGATVMQAIAAQARIIEVDELERRVSALEGKQSANT